MSSTDALSPDTSRSIANKLESLAKSFAAGYQGLSNAGRTGLSALTGDSLDPVLRSITMEEKDFLLTKDIPVIKATQSVYMYNVKTAVQSNLDLAGWETFLPQEDTSQYMRVAEVLKVYGIRKSITQMAALTNQAGGFLIDIEKENDLNAALALAQAMERDGYIGGDMYLAADGSIDATIAANPQFQSIIRQARGIQANIREGDQSARGISGDFVGYGNNRSVVFDRKGGVLDRAFLDKVVTAVKDSRGAVKEAHCTTSQLAEFRATFFPFERGDLGSAYAIRGAGITNDEQNALPIPTVGGVIDFIPTVFKYQRQKAEPVVSGQGNMPITITTIGAPAASASITGSGFAVAEQYVYQFQSANMFGLNVGQASSVYTVGGADANKAVEVALTLSAGHNISHINVFRSPKEALGDVSKCFFVGRIAVVPGQTAVKLVDNNRIIPGLDSVVMLPKDKNRAKMAVLGNLVNKMVLGQTGPAEQTMYTSYLAFIVDRPRSFALVDNVFQNREGL